MKYTAPSGLKLIPVPVVNNTFDYTIMFEPGSDGNVTLEFIPIGPNPPCSTDIKIVNCSQPWTPDTLSFDVMVSPTPLCVNTYADIIIKALKNWIVNPGYKDASMIIEVVDANDNSVPSSDIVLPNNGFAYMEASDAWIKVLLNSLMVRKTGTFTIIVKDYFDNTIRWSMTFGVKDCTETFICTWSDPVNANLCQWDDQWLSQNTPKTAVSSCTSSKKCEYTCATGFEFKNDICQRINNPITYVCAWATPANTTICPWDDGWLTVDTPKSLVSICSDTKKCEYTCSTEYRFDVATMACIRQNYSGTPPPVGWPVPPQQPNPPSRPTPPDGSAPNRRIVDNIKRMIQILSDNCDYADKDYYQVLQKYKDVRGKQDPHDPAVILTTYCITNGYRRMLQQQFNSDAFASVYEAIKILSKIHAIGSGTKFDEKTPARPQVSYRDVARGRYTDYVNYAYDAWILDWVVRWSDLKWFTPLQTTQLETMLINAGKDTTPYSAFFRKATIRRDTMAEIFVDIYAEKFVYIEYMMGENIRFYELLLKQLQWLSATQQETYIKNLIQRMKSRDRGQLETKLNIYVDGVIKFLEQEVLMK